MTRNTCNLLYWCVSLLLSTPAFADVPSILAIRNARIVTVSGPVIPRGNVVLRGGLIEAVGANASIPADAWVLEGEGLTVYPGLIDGLSTLGITDESAIGSAVPIGPRRLAGTETPGAAAAAPAAPARGPEDRPATTSWLHAADLVKPTDRRLEPARNAGFTSAVTFPTRGIFCGQGAVVNLAGSRGGKMVVDPSVGQYITLATSGFTSFPGSTMGVISYIRQLYLDADYYRKAKAFYSSHAGVMRPEYDRALEGVLESQRVLLPANRTVDIERMIRFAAELKVKPVLYGLQRGYAATPSIANSGVPVLVSLKWPERSKEADPSELDSVKTLELREDAPTTPKALAAAKIKFGFYSDGIERPRDIWKAVKRAIVAGLSPEDAVRALTLSNAEIFGVADRMGSIEKGKIANLVVTKGNLFEDTTKVQYVIVDGTKFEPVITPEPEKTPETPAEEEDK